MKTILASASLSLLLSAAHAAPPGTAPRVEPKLAMNVDPGLWEVTTAGAMSGAPVIPAETLARLPPEAQAKIQAAMARANQVKKYKECMTPDKLQRGFARNDGPGGADGKCQLTVTANTSSQFQAEQVCPADQGASTDARISFTLTSRHQTQGTVDVTITQQDGKTSVIHRTIDAQWLGADCGTIKDIEAEK